LYAHWQLARIERQWRTLADGAKSLLLAARLHDRFWGHALLAMIYVRNRSWAAGANVIPYTALHGHNPDLSNLRTFGCPAYVHIDSSQRAKLSSKDWQGIFVGYAFDSPAWLVYNPVTNKVVGSRSVVFDETWLQPLPSFMTTREPPPSTVPALNPPNASRETPRSHPLTVYDDFNEDPPIPAFLPPQVDIARAATASRLQATEVALPSVKRITLATAASVPAPKPPPHPSLSPPAMTPLYPHPSPFSSPAHT
jgi:hypothetical protein